MSTAPDERDVLPFASATKFRSWLKKNHASHPGVWIKFAKKASGIPSITYAEALDEALCFGWIDGPIRKVEEPHWIHLFKRRNPRSVWSQVNKGHIARLTAAGLTQPTGQTEVDAAKADGRWDAAYASASTAQVPEDFVSAVAKHKVAQTTYTALNKSLRYHIYYQLQSAKKPETRARRFDQLLDKLKRGEKPM